jgi:hypothetical protein
LGVLPPGFFFFALTFFEFLFVVGLSFGVAHGGALL